jgi:hypothetical protein
MDGKKRRGRSARLGRPPIRRADHPESEYSAHLWWRHWVMRWIRPLSPPRVRVSRFGVANSLACRLPHVSFRLQPPPPPVSLCAARRATGGAFTVWDDRFAVDHTAVNEVVRGRCAWVRFGGWRWPRFRCAHYPLPINPWHEPACLQRGCAVPSSRTLIGLHCHTRRAMRGPAMIVWVCLECGLGGKFG